MLNEEEVGLEARLDSRSDRVVSEGSRREEILDVAFSVLAEKGYRSANTREIAARAHASKETLYAWFGDKRGLFEELIRWQAQRVDKAVSSSLDRGDGDNDEPAVVLRAFAIELLRLLVGERSVVINRAAISEAATDPTFAEILSAEGRGSVVPKLESYLEDQAEHEILDLRHFEDAGTAAEALIGLVVGDLQVRRLLGAVTEPKIDRIEARADQAVRTFLALVAPGSTPWALGDV